VPIKTASSPLPPFIEPQLATLVPQAPEGDDWIHELKFDGYRILARAEQGRVGLLSRRAHDWTAKFPSVSAAVAKLPAGTALLDGEVAVPLPDGRTSFQALQNALGRQGAGTVYYVFDLLHLDGRDLRGEPLETRKAALKDLIAAAPAGLPIQFSDHVVGNGKSFLEQARSRGLEGIVSKRRREPHRSGRSPGWLKTKCISRQEFVIGGYTEPEGSREGLGALLIGYYRGHDDPAKLVFAGKVGTGFTQALLRQLRRKLTALELPDPPFAERPPREFVGSRVHWTRPELVAEVAFTEWTDDGRLRHPSFQGLREDKPASDVVREAPVLGITSPAEPPAAAEEAPEDSVPEGGASSARPGPRAPERKARKSMKMPQAGKPREEVKPAKEVQADRKSPTRQSPKSPKTPKSPESQMTGGGPTLKKGEVEVLGERLSHPGRIYYPEAGITKLDLARYYEAVGENMLPHVRGRPLSLVRCPAGVAGGCFYAKHVAMPVSQSLAQIPIRESKKIGQYLVVDSVAGLIALAQMGMLEIHTWNSTREHLEQPDRFVLDLDPGPDVPWPEVVEAAKLCRSTLSGVGLESFVKTTGGKGLHVVVPTVPELDWDGSLALSKAIAELIVKQHPRRYTTAMPKAGRERKILIDFFRNGRGATSVAAFSTRARPEATVSVPIAWEELDSGKPSARFTLASVPKRLASLLQRSSEGDPWRRYFSLKQKVPRDLARLLGKTSG
jgi:bifunctional non-homologous end joining protein LigD